MIKKQFSSLYRSWAAAVVFMLLAPTFGIRGETPPKTLTERQKIVHVLSRLGFGARPGDIEKVKAMGLHKYIDRQLDPKSIDDAAAESKVRALDVFNLSTAELFAKYPNPGALLQQLEGRNRQQQDPQELTQDQQRERRQKIQELYAKYDLKPAQQILPQIVANRVLRAVYSERQLQEVMVDFWQNHFNVFAGKAAVRWYIPSYERDVLRKNALGNFKDLLVGTAQHPAMLFYLDNFESVSPNSQLAGSRGGNSVQRRRRGINENYARELLELHTLGVDNGYTQTDIVGVAKCFTGWTIADPRGYRRAAAATIQGTEDMRTERIQRRFGVPGDVESGEFYFNARWHEGGTKTVMGQKIDEGGINDGLKVLDMLVASPKTAKFIARKLAVKFVSDDPSDALVQRVADAFHKSKGDIKTTLRALLTDKEFFARENYRAKIKSPFELAVSSLRTLNAETNGGPAFAAMLNKLGEVPYGYQAPTGYPDTAEDWVNTGALLERLNFAVAVASNRIPGTFVNLKSFDSEDKAHVLDRAVAAILDGEISPATKATLAKQIEQPLPEVKSGSELTEQEMDIPNMREGQQGRRNRQARLLDPSGNPEVFKVVSLVLGTPEFQRQ